MRTRAATTADAEAMSAVLFAIMAETGRTRPADRHTVTTTYLAHPDRIACTVALAGAGEVVGFQSLRRAAADNPYGAPEGWGIIGTHVAPKAHRMGAGTALFAATLQAAAAVGLEAIDAGIGAANHRALAYYESRGFRPWKLTDGLVHKVYRLAPLPAPM